MTPSFISESWSNCSQRTAVQILHAAGTLDSTRDRRELVQFSGQADSQLSASFSPPNSFCIYILNSSPGLEKKTIFPDSDFFQYLISWCLCVFLTGRPMGLQSCKLCNSCLQSKGECGPAGGCSRVCNDWRYCSDRCCDICCQMCVDVCSGLCSGDCSYTFCTLCLTLAQNCISLFTTQQSRASVAQRKSFIPNAIIYK